MNSDSEKTMFTGYLTFRNIDFTFTFDGDVLRLIPPKDKEKEIFESWTLPSLPGFFNASGPTKKINELQMKKALLVGRRSESESVIIFLPQRNTNMTPFNYDFLVKIDAWFECNDEKQRINRMTFSAPEVDRIYPFNLAWDEKFQTREIPPQKLLESPKRRFYINQCENRPLNVEKKRGKKHWVDAYFGVEPVSDSQDNVFRSFLAFEFKPTVNRPFLFTLWRVAKRFLQFLCYRRNVFLPEAKLFGPDLKDNAILHVLGESGPQDDEALEKNRCVKQAHIAGSEEKILSAIASYLLVFWHFPESSVEGGYIDPGRFILITAAFEWEYKRWKKIKRPKTALHENIKEISKLFDNVVGDYAKILFRCNGQTFAVDKMAKRFADQRNRYAHGNLDELFDGMALLGVVHMEHLIYAMQLRRFGVDDLNIQRAVNELFGLGMNPDTM